MEFDDLESVHSILESLPDEAAAHSADAFPRIRGDFIVTDVPLLSPPRERGLFLRMNCLKFLAEQRRQRAKNRGVEPNDLRTIQNLLDDANSVRDEIATANLRLVTSIARRFSLNRRVCDDLVSEGYLTLLRAIDHFDVSLGFRFSTYVTHSIQRHLVRIVRREERHHNCSGEDLENAIVDPKEPEIISLDRRQLVKRLLLDMPERTRRMVELRFGLSDGSRGMSYRAIGVKFGVSAERARQLITHSCRQAYAKHAKQFEF